MEVQKGSITAQHRSPARAVVRFTPGSCDRRQRMKRWNWTWEEPRSAATRPSRDASAGRSDARAPAGPWPSPRPTRAHFAAAAPPPSSPLVAIFALLVVALTTQRRRTCRSIARRRARPPRATLAAAAERRPARGARRPGAEQGDRPGARLYARDYRAADAQGNEVALTFDDGPGPYTERLVRRPQRAPRARDLLRHRRGGAILLAGNARSSCAPATSSATTPRPTR